MTHERAADVPPDRKPPRRRLRRALLLLFCVMIFTEILLRLIFGFGNPILYQSDPDCAYLVKPDQKVYRFFCHNDINHYGMRSADFVMPRPQNTLRVMMLGDSLTYGTSFVNQGEIFTSLLHDPLSKAEGKEVEILNASAGYWAPGNEFGYLKTRGTFDSNVVLFVWNSGDPTQVFAIFGGGPNMPVERPWSAIGEVLYRYVKPRIIPPPPDPVAEIPSPPEQERIRAANFEILRQARELCEKSGAMLGVVFVPFPGIRESFAQENYRSVVQWTQQNGVPLIDVAPAFAKESSEKLTIDGMHLRPYGHQVVAAEIARQWPTIDAALASRNTQPATAASQPATTQP